MKRSSIFGLFQKISIVFIIFISLIVLFVGEVNLAEAKSINSLVLSEGKIIEHLRLNVPKTDLEAWLFAEKKSWEPWLAKKSGFLGRQLFWDEERQEATLLISWENRETWKNIPQSEIDSVQNTFEEIARKATGKEEGNPFPLLFEGELLPK